MKHILIASVAFILLLGLSSCSSTESSGIPNQSHTPPSEDIQTQLIPILERVSIQKEYADNKHIIDNQWVAVGLKKSHAINKDFAHPYQAKPSYCFELREEDNSLSGYEAGTTKGRAELSYAYATPQDFKSLNLDEYKAAQKMKTVYHYGKGITPQGSERNYTFSILIPTDLSPDVSTIFAQWHGTPDRRLVQTPQGLVKKLSTEEFLELEKNTIFKKDKGHEKIITRDKKGNLKVTAGEPNGWLIEQGGYPPLAFGFSDGLFYIKANSDRKWMTDKTDRCHANPSKRPILKPLQSKFKTSTIAYKMPLSLFPKDQWVSFTIKVRWTSYSGETEQILKPGLLHVEMHYKEEENEVKKILVNQEEILLGRNDETGYYFKFGIYRVGDNTVPLYYHLAGYQEY